MLGFFTLTLFTIICGIAGVNQYSVGLWPLFFCDLVIECMANPDNAMGLCCLPIQIKAKWYPVILIVIFSLFFGFQIDFWCGLAMGYAYVYGLFSKIEMGVNKATQLEEKWPFKSFQGNKNFVTAGGAMGGEVLPRFNNSSARETNASAAALASSSAAPSSNFKSFGGTGKSIGGASLASLSTGNNPRGRSTPATRAASAAESSSDG